LVDPTPFLSPSPFSNDWKSYFKCKLTPPSNIQGVSFLCVNFEVLKTTTTTNTNIYHPNMANVDVGAVLQ
jgi:hypothetical protein